MRSESSSRSSLQSNWEEDDDDQLEWAMLSILQSNWGGDDGGKKEEPGAHSASRTGTRGVGWSFGMRLGWREWAKLSIIWSLNWIWAFNKDAWLHLIKHMRDNSLLLHLPRRFVIGFFTLHHRTWLMFFLCIQQHLNPIQKSHKLLILFYFCFGDRQLFTELFN